MKTKRSSLQRILSLLLSGSLLFSLLPAAALAAEKVTPPAGKLLVEQTDYTLVQGVTETDVFLNETSGNAQIAGYMLTVEPDAKATFKASYTGYYAAGSTVDSRRNSASSLKWVLGTTTDQAKAYEKATQGTVIAATNGDYYNMQTGRPLGYLVMEGNVVQQNNGSSNEPYFAVLNDGSYAIRDAGEDHSDVREAISGPFFLVRNGSVVVDDSNRDLMPRNSVGIKADGSVVTFVADGRQYPYSVGMTIYDLACYLKEQGAVDAIYLDGGGSATMATRREGTSRLEVRNSPSDGVERTVSSALLLVSTADQDGQFDHASVLPNNQLYTPGSQVQFTASGVDVSGGPADLPQDLHWALADSGCGAIDSDGLFTAADNFRGDVTAELYSGEERIGATTVTIADVTELTFTGDAISLDFNAQSDLGLSAKSNGRSIHVKDGDFVWQFGGKDGAAIGSVADNMFTAAGGTSTLTGTVTAKYAYDQSLSATISVEIGKMPVVLMDFEPNKNGPLTAAHYHWGKPDFVNAGLTPGYQGKDGKTYVFNGNYDVTVPAGDIFRADGYSFYLWPNNSITTYNVGKVQTTTQADGGYVRFGDYALELNYDYSSYNGSQNSNFYLRYCGDPVALEGYPSEIGVWVYVPEGSWPYALYTDLAYWDSGKNAYTNKSAIQLYHAKNGDSSDRRPENLSNMTDWTGWKYCFADISDLVANYQNTEHPISYLPGRGLFWISYQPGGDTEFKGRKNGSLYFDNLRVVYGTNLDDLDNPIVDSIAINGTALEDNGGDATISKNDVEIVSKYHDVDGANKTGIDAAATELLIDGNPLPADKAADSATCRVNLTNGHHVVTVRVYDKFGNAAEMSRGFTVFNGSAEETNTVSLTGDAFVPLGGDYTMKVVATEQIQDATVTLSNLNADLGEPTVTARKGWTIQSKDYRSTGYKKAALSFKVVKSPVMTMSLDDLLTDELAEITFHIDKKLDITVNSFTCTAKISYTDAEGQTGTAALPGVKYALSAYYTVKPGVQVEGQSSVVTVLNKDGTPAAGVTVYLNGTSIGQTNEAGELETDAMASLPAGTEYTLSAEGPKGLSEGVKATVLSNSFGESAPFQGIHTNAAKDSATAQNISFFGDPVRTRAQAQVRYRVSGSDADWKTANGSSKLTSFATSKDSARINTVTITGLAANTTYEYQVGDGEKWSDSNRFKTAPAAGEKTAFFVMGDTQMNGNPETAADQEALKIMQDLSGILNGKQVDFGLQTGDYVDNGANLPMWEEIQDAFRACYPETDIVHTLGNHEYYGNPNGDIANQVLQLPGRDYYSVEYGNVYVAVINNSADLADACQWLVDDAAKSSCQWKVLSIHQPPYYTNPGGGSERFHEAIPAAAEAAGIDVVFSGHDHSYARTPMMKDGQTVEENGVVYLICGDLGEKSRDNNYAINSKFDYACATQEYTGVMLYVSADADKLSITAYNSDGGVILDSVEIASACSAGHDYTLYDNGNAVCQRCGHKETPASLNYTGWLTVKGSKDQMYFVAGQYKTGWFTLGTTTYHFSPEGIMHQTETVDTRTCTKSGAFVTTCLVCGAKQSGQSMWPEGHKWDENHVCTKCGFAGRDISKADLKIYNATMDDPRAAVSVTYNGEKLTIRSSQVNSDGYVTYANNSGVGMGTVTIRGCGDYYGEISGQYKITPSVVKELRADASTQNTIDLSWTASKGATQYRVEISKDDGATWKPVAYPETNRLTVTGLALKTKYSFRVYGFTYVNGTAFSAPHYSPTLAAYTKSEDEITSRDLVANVSAAVSGQTLNMENVGGSVYLFLPSAADLGRLPMTFTLRSGAEGAVTLTGDKGSLTLDSLAQTVDLSRVLAGGQGRVMISVGQLPPMTLYVMKASDIPTLYLTSDDAKGQGRDFVDANKNNRTTGSMKLVTSDDGLRYDGALTQIKARGNTTFTNAEKKSYQIKLSKKTDLLGSGTPGKTWVLLAGYFDATQMHDKTFKDLAAELGMSYVPGCDWVDLYYDGEYRGIYLLGEKNSVGSSGIDITDMEKAYSAANANYGANAEITTGQNRFGRSIQYTSGLTEPGNITGGYLLELNFQGIDEASGFTTNQGASFNVKSPEWCGKAAMEYISEYYQEFENAVYAVDENGVHTGYNAETGKYYYEYCDLTSLVQMYLLEELSNNVDGFYSSFYFYKDADGILYAGPVWDMESTCGTGWNGTVAADYEFINGRYLASSLTQIPGFMEAVRDYYRSSFRPAALALTGSSGKIAGSVQRISDSAAMNYILWPLIKVGNPSRNDHLWESGASYKSVTESMLRWMAARIAVLDAAYPGAGPVDPTQPTGGSTEPGQPTGGGSTTPDQPTGGATIPDQPTGGDTKPTTPNQPGGGGSGGGGGTSGGGASSGGAPEVTVPDTQEQFTDVASSSYYHDAVLWAVKKGITSGLTPTTFGPDVSCTRAHAVMFLWRAAGSPKPEGREMPFADVAAGDYYYDAVLWALENGVTSGTSEHTFGPNDVCTRAQIVTFLYRALHGTPGEQTKFTDVSADAFYGEAVSWAVTNGVTSGTSAVTFGPNADCTRAQIVTFLYKAYMKQ